MVIPEEMKHNKFRDVRVISPKDLILSNTVAAQIPTESNYSGDNVRINNPGRKIDIDIASLESEENAE